MTEEQKWAFLHSIPWKDATHPDMRRIAAALWIAAGYTPNRERTFALLAHAFAGRAIKFVRDMARVGQEDIAGLTRNPNPDDAIDAIRRGKDDCDAKARSFVALCLAIGMKARMMPIWKNDPMTGEPILAHVYPEVELDGRWFPAETILSRAVIGEPPLSVPKEENGKWLLT